MHDTHPTHLQGDILIVDDDLNSLQLLSNLLIDKGYDVRGAQNGLAALTFIENDPPELILLDVRMPEMDGYAVCRQLKANAKYRDIPILFLSALDETADKVRGLNAGAVDFITKPIQTEEVLARVDTHLSLSRLRHHLEQQIASRTADLKESEERYRLIIEASPISIFTIRDGCFISANPSGCRMLGYSGSEEIMGKPVLRFVAKASQSLVEERIRRLDEGKSNPLGEIALSRRDGSPFTVESSSVAVSIEGQNTIMVFAHDITNRKLREQRLRMMQYSIDHSLEQILWIAPDGRFLYANEAACRGMNYSRDQMLSMSVTDVDPAFSKEEWAAHFKTLREIGFVRSEVQQISGLGEIHDLDVSSSYNNFSGTEFICSFGRDITELKKAQNKIKEEKVKFEAFMAHLPAHAYIKDEDLHHQYGNRAALELAGVELDEFKQTTSRDVFSSDVASQLEAADRKVLAGDAPVIIEREMELKVGQTFWNQDIKFPITMPDGKKWIGGIAFDITDFKILEADLKQQLSFETLLADLSTGFINLSAKETHSYFKIALQKVGDHFSLDRSSILLFNSEQNELLRTHMWEREGIPSDPHGLILAVNEKFPYIFKQIKLCQKVIVPDTTQMAPAASAAMAYCRQLGIRSLCMIPLLVGKNNLGGIVFSWIHSQKDFSSELIAQLQLVSMIFANAIARQKADRILQKSREEARLLAGKLLNVQEQERKRLARELHDDLSQRLAVLAMTAGQLEPEVSAGSHEAAQKLRDIRQNLVKLSEDVHAISRQLHPSILDDLGLVDAVRSECSAFARREGIRVDYQHLQMPAYVSNEVALCFFRIIQEGLRNIAKHAQARRALIVLTGDEAGDIRLEVSDQGRGFNWDEGQKKHGLGLISMHERVRMINGHMEITTSPGKGTCIRVIAAAQEAAQTGSSP